MNILFFLSLIASAVLKESKFKGYLIKVEIKNEYMVPTIKPLDYLESDSYKFLGKLAIQIPRTCSERANLNIGCGMGSALSFIRYLKIY